MRASSRRARPAPRPTARARRSGPESRYHHGALRAALLHAARELLEAQGLQALTLRAAARRAGVSPAAPYNHFADKAALLAAVAGEGFEAFAQAMRQEMAAAVGPQARLNAAGVAYVCFAVANPALFKLMFGALGSQLSADEALTAARDEAYGVLQQAVQTALGASTGLGEEGALRSLRSWSLAHGLATLLNDGALTPKAYGAGSARELAAMLLRPPAGSAPDAAATATATATATVSKRRRPRQ